VKTIELTVGDDRIWDELLAEAAAHKERTGEDLRVRAVGRNVVLVTAEEDVVLMLKLKYL
jgi:hypothetical protein